IRQAHRYARDAVVYEDSLPVPAAALRRLWRPAAQDHLGAADADHHRCAEQRYLPMAAQTRQGARCIRARARAGMSRTSGRQRQSLWAIFRVPVLLAVLSIIGLVSALVGDELWDVLSWVMLGV